MSKLHWNTLEMTGRLTDDFVKTLVDESYDLVVMKLNHKEQQKLKNY